MKNLKEQYGNIAMITGASGGLGEEFAIQLAEQGLDLILVARSKDKLENLSNTLKSKYGVKVWVKIADLSDSSDTQKLIDEVKKEKLDISLLINNAGFGSFGFFHDLDGKNEAKMIDVNIKSPVMLTSAFLPKMVQNKKGAIVFLGSVGSYQPTPFFSNYSATKAWNLMFAESLWAEVRKEGVDVICLSPGYTRTEFQENAGAYGQKPLGGWSEPKDVVKRCFSMLGKKPSTIPGFMNWFLAWNIRFTPRRIAPLVSYNLFKPKKSIS
jgi:uncharacterized protein